MKSSAFKKINFLSQDDKDFGVTIKNRVGEYFGSKNVSRTGDYRIWVKVIVLPLIYLTPFAVLLTNSLSDSLPLFYCMWLIMGIGIAGCGLGIMHDACHGALSKNKSVNYVVGLVINLAGGYALNWKIQHNVLHHSYTNIDGYDEDIHTAGMMRFSPHQPVKWFYRFQIVYAWFLYGLMTFSWVTYKDFLGLIRYNQKGLVKAQGNTFTKELVKLILQKVFYYCVFMLLPLIFLDVAWWHVLLGWFCMHFVGGLILACIFQPAHVVPTSEFPLPDQDSNVHGDWVVHQMLTTANFAPNNLLLSWYVGGLNYQIEHHLFPNMCHIHHREVSNIVQQTAKEFGLPYHSTPTLFGALINHAKMLHSLRK